MVWREWGYKSLIDCAPSVRVQNQNCVAEGRPNRSFERSRVYLPTVLDNDLAVHDE